MLYNFWGVCKSEVCFCFRFTMNFQTIALYFLAKIVLSTAIFSSNYFDKEIDQDPCICVPFWECKEDFSGLSFEEIKILDRRYIFRKYLTHYTIKFLSATTKDCEAHEEVLVQVNLMYVVELNVVDEMLISKLTIITTISSFEYMVGMMLNSLNFLGF